MNQAEQQYKKTLKKINEGKRVSPLKIIRLHCFDCCGYQANEVRLCPANDCISWAFRMGKNPVPKKISEKQRKEASKRLARMRFKKVSPLTVKEKKFKI